MTGQPATEQSTEQTTVVSSKHSSAVVVYTSKKQQLSATFYDGKLSPGTMYQVFNSSPTRGWQQSVSKRGVFALPVS